jgi:hypothetical protein
MRRVSLALLASASILIAGPALAQAPQVEKNVSMGMALAIIQGTIEQCTKDGYKVIGNQQGGTYFSIPLPREKFIAKANIKMQKTVAISGIVQTEDGVPVGQGEVVPNERNGYYGNQNVSFPISSEGKFAVQVLPLKSYRVRAETGPYPVAYSDSVQVNDKPVSGVVVKVSPGGTLAGIVLAPDGKPAPRMTPDEARALGRLGLALQNARSLSPTRSTMAWKPSSPAMPCWMLLITSSSAARWRSASKLCAFCNAKLNAAPTVAMNLTSLSANACSATLPMAKTPSASSPSNSGM